VGNILLCAFPKALWLLETAAVILVQGVFERYTVGISSGLSTVQKFFSVIIVFK
jgi:hypothetical protein